MKIVLIAPYRDLLETAITVKKDLNVDIELELGDLSEGVKVAREWEKKGVDIIISRGGTYQLIKESVSVPVVEIKVSAFDILRQFNGLIGCKEIIGVAGYKNVIYGCEVIGEILDLNLIKVVIEKEEEGLRQVAAAKEKGVSLIIGDTIGAYSAKRLGLKSRLITSGKEAVAAAVSESFRLAQALKAEKEKAEQIRTIVDFVHDGIIAIDKEGRVSIYNRMAEKIFKRPPAEAVGRKVETVVPNTRLYEVIETGKPQIGELQEVLGTMIATNRVPIVVGNEVVGAVATFQDVTMLQKVEQKIRRQLADRGLVAMYTFDDIIYSSEKMKDVVNQAKKYALLDSTVLIFGETGTGKELFAQSIHNASRRKNGPFVAINCAALPENLLESELFGYAEGAFTGARKGGKAGLFELAHGGTIFLDEIGEMPPGLQSKLLRVIQERRVMRIGDDRLIPVDVRIICATNRELVEMIKQGKFREDLFYRINVLQINIPPLRERKEDLDVLVPHFIKKYSLGCGKYINGLTSRAMDFLKTFNFPGNVRELESIIERACALCEGTLIDVGDIRFYQREESDVMPKMESHDIKPLEEIEREYIAKAIRLAGGNLSEAARKLGVNRTTLWRKLKENKK
ncbi:sigma 54-interacting transcriptional regulator [Thermoanaerobacter sp. CM-CNRG TB177]|uniref:sigma 54-interacting transcriptional regulator n=1 Tax=Thermoanaerobacter sp. CM-CNRG TB177 TaxID=2800659 RepID=UPI001BDE9F8D|nr:sigma 54-interacting transcriptional regulator [Thermoanaerobacter sp. CM-CNRG TB177]MBT1278998.1 sigma 54-interacting transcriptional regulator [Thermoanaerobacter sp. CM-CNRG TB177]